MSGRNRFEAITEFVAVAQRSSFTKAAEDLRVDASVVSRRVAALEARLGVQLFQRTTRRVVLTEAGQEYLLRAQDVLSRLEQADAAVSMHATQPAGVLRVAVPALFGQRRIAPLIRPLRERHPQLRLEMIFSDEFDDLIGSRLDCAVRIGALEHGGDLMVRRLTRNRRLLCASPDYVQRRSSPANPNELRDHDLLHFERLKTGRHWALTRADERLSVPVDPLYSADNAEALRIAARDGLGIALLASFVVEEDLRSGALVRVMPEWTPAESVVSIVYPNVPFVDLRVRAFVQFLVEAFQGEPSWDRDLLF